MEKNITKEYSNDDLTVIWKPAKCIHAGICVKSLPDVYDPKGKPWIKPENASAEELIKQIDQCPSGALSYRSNKEVAEEGLNKSEVSVEVFTDGPLLIYGPVKIKYKGRDSINESRTVAFCRCGHSANKPFCDGTHKKTEFKD